jgi:hypothetical protein
LFVEEYIRSNQMAILVNIASLLYWVMLLPIRDKYSIFHILLITQQFLRSVDITNTIFKFWLLSRYCTFFACWSWQFLLLLDIITVFVLHLFGRYCLLFVNYVPIVLFPTSILTKLYYML